MNQGSGMSLTSAAFLFEELNYDYPWLEPFCPRV